MAKVKYAASSKKTKSVTTLPGCVLKIKGKLDSKKGKGVCDEYIRQLYMKLAALESNEVIGAEKGLFNSRKEAAVILTGLSEQKKVLSGIRENKKEESVEDIRSNRKNAERRESVKAELRNALEKLTVINEQIINTNTILDERINRMRSNASEKIHAYVVGIKCGELSEYEHVISDVNDSAREIYRAKHEELDEKIKKVVELKREEEAAA